MGLTTTLTMVEGLVASAVGMLLMGIALEICLEMLARSESIWLIGRGAA